MLLFYFFKKFLNERQDESTQAVLDVKFLPWFTSTHGLTRPNSPEEASRQRYFTILNDSIKEPMLSRLTPDAIERIAKSVNRIDLIGKYATTSVRLFRADVERHYLWSIKKAIIDYVLRDEEEQRRLGIGMIKKVSFI